MAPAGNKRSFRWARSVAAAAGFLSRRGETPEVLPGPGPVRKTTVFPGPAPGGGAP